MQKTLFLIILFEVQFILSNPNTQNTAEPVTMEVLKYWDYGELINNTEFYYLYSDNRTENGTYIVCKPDRYATAIMAIVCIALVIILIGTAGGNFLVILAVILVKKLQTPSNLLIVSLAFSDLFVALLVMPFTILYFMYGFWPFNEGICDMYVSFDVLLCTSSILNLCAISIDRYLVITKPLEYAARRTPSLMGILIACAWALAALISIPPNFGWKQPNSYQDCNCQYSSDIGYQIYATTCAFYLPLLVMLVLYGRIFKLAREMSKADAKQKAAAQQDDTFSDGRNGSVADDDARQLIQTSADGSIINGGRKGSDISLGTRARSKRLGGGDKKEKAKKNNTESKAIKTLGVIMGCFCLCWLPFFLLQLLTALLESAGRKDISESIPKPLKDFLLWLGYMNSFINPIIYAKFNREFRLPFKLILMCQCSNINNRLRSETYAAQYGLPSSSQRRSRVPHSMQMLTKNSTTNV